MVRKKPYKRFRKDVGQLGGAAIKIGVSSAVVAGLPGDNAVKAPLQQGLGTAGSFIGPLAGASAGRAAIDTLRGAQKSKKKRQRKRRQLRFNTII